MTTTPGYLVTITAFLPADPQSPREMEIADRILAAGWRRSPQPADQRVAEIRRRHNARQPPTAASAVSDFYEHAEADIAYLLSLLGGDR